MAKNNTTNIAKIENGIILKTRTSKTSGTQDTKGQAFYANAHLNHKASKSSLFDFDAPKYSAETAGTLDFVSQTSLSIFEVYGRPEFRLSFTANTEAFSASSYAYMSHDLYKIPYNLIESYRNNLSVDYFNKVVDRLENPLISFTAQTATTFTLAQFGTGYTFSPEQIDKPIRGLSEELFEDKAAYFFNTRHTFKKVLNNYQGIIAMTNNDGIMQPVGDFSFYNPNVQIKTEGDVSIIQAGPWSGKTAKGMFFTCFYPPSKPKMESPLPEEFSGLTSTPEFYFSNVSDGDSYVIDITYQNINSGFTIQSATSKYFYTKEEVASGTQRRATLEKTSFLSESTRRASVPLIPGSTYWYRVGNIKEVVNLFGVKQQIINYTSATQAAAFSGQSISYVLDSFATKLPPSQSGGGQTQQTGQFQGLPPTK